MVWYSHLLKNFPQFVVIHIVEPFGIVNKAEVHVFLGEGNGNPLQRSCLENPRDGESLVGCRLWSRTESDTNKAT